MMWTRLVKDTRREEDPDWADVAIRRLESLEKEHSQLEDEEREASLPDALADRTKVVKLVVDKWFVFGFVKVTTGEVIFIHASVVRGAEVLMIGIDAWVQVMRDDARAQGRGVSSMQSLGTCPVERGERRREGKQSGRASEASSGVDGRAGSSVGEGSLRPGLHDEPAKTSNVTSPVMISPFSLVASSSLAASDSSLPAGTGFFNHAGGFRGVQPRTATRAQEVATMLDETLGFYVKATGKDESLMRGQFTRMKLESLLKERARWRRNNGSKTRKKKRGSCSRDNRDWEPRVERSLSGKYKQKAQEYSPVGSSSTDEKFLQAWWKICSKSLWHKTERRKPEKSRAWSRRILTPTDVVHGRRYRIRESSFCRRFLHLETEPRRQTGR